MKPINIVFQSNVFVARFMHNLFSAIIEQLELQLATAISASQDAHSSATHSENIADNKYDTLAVEAAYLAHGQSMRISDLQETIHRYKHFQRPTFTPQSSIRLGALVDLENNKGEVQRVFIGPAAGGLKIGESLHTITVVTTSTPLGRALLDKCIDDEIELNINNRLEKFIVVDIQ